MHCPHCNNALPDDSRFCGFCGKMLPPPAPKAPVPPTYEKEPATKTLFCRRCGKPVDEETKRCFGCGKQHFRGVPPMVFLCIVLTVAILGLMALCILQELAYNARINELEQLVDFYKSI